MQIREFVFGNRELRASIREFALSLMLGLAASHKPNGAH